MNLRNDVLNALKWLAGARLFGQIISWSVTLLVIRILSPTDYGLMAIATVFIGFAALFREIGLYDAMVQKRDLEAYQIEQAFGLLILGNSFIYILIYFLAPVFSLFYDDTRLTLIIRILGLQFPLAAFGIVQDAMLSRNMDFRKKAYVNLSVVLGASLTTLAFAMFNFGVWALVFGNMAGTLIRPFGLTLAARHWCRPRFSSKGMTDLLRFGGFVTANRMIWYVYTQSDILIIGKVLGKEMLGIYAIAMQLASLPMQKVSGIINQIGLAAYSTVQNNMDLLKYNFLKVVRINSFLAFPIFWGISCISPELVRGVLSEKWQMAILPLQIISFMMPLRMVVHGGDSALDAIGKPHIGTFNSFIALLIMPVSFYFGSKYWGLIGASSTWLLVYPMIAFMQLKLSLPALAINIIDYFSSMSAPAIGSLVMYITVILSRIYIAEPFMSPLQGLVFLVTVGALVYTAFMWLARKSAFQEFISLLSKR